jgi:hypothetical protein
LIQNELKKKLTCKIIFSAREAQKRNNKKSPNILQNMTVINGYIGVNIAVTSDLPRIKRPTAVLSTIFFHVDHLGRGQFFI